MKIKRVEVVNFRGLEKISFSPEEKINVIVGPNAVGKTTILEAIRLVKALLAPRFSQETQQVLISLGVISPHFQFFGSQHLDFATIIRDIQSPLKVLVEFVISSYELDILKANAQNLALLIMRGQMGRNDDQAIFALTQFISSESGKKEYDNKVLEVHENLKNIGPDQSFRLSLTLDSATNQIMGQDVFSQSVIAFLEQLLPAQTALFSYFPADRAFPVGEVPIQISSQDASSQIQSHLGTPANKYQRLKQTLVNGIITREINEDWIKDEFNTILDTLLPGKAYDSININQIGQCKIYIKERATGKRFDIDNMSSDEKGVVLTYLLSRQTVAQGGILLIDEPELHLNPAVQSKLIPFLVNYCVNPNNLQVIICTHSPEVLGAAYEREDSALFHLRSEKDLSKIFRKDHSEIFEALRLLGASTADVLFSKGSVFVEGEHDIDILTEGFSDLLSGFKVSQLGGRSSVEKEIERLQTAEQKEDLTRPNLFVFDFDTKISTKSSTKLVIVKQWDRYCLENYLLDEKILFEKVREHAQIKPESRGSFENCLKDFALNQLTEVAFREVYSLLSPENPGLRSKEVKGKNLNDIAILLAERLLKIQNQTTHFKKDPWIEEFIKQTKTKQQELKNIWELDWIKKCNGKKIFDDLYLKYTINIDKLSFKKQIIKQMAAERSENWRLIDSILRDISITALY